MEYFFNCLIGFVCIIIIFVNFCVLLSSGFLIQRGQQPRATYIYLGNLSLSDLVTGIMNLWIIIFPHQFHNEFICSTSLSLTVTALLASGFSIGLIAIDRYLYILYGLYYHRYLTTQRPYCMVSLIWFVSGVFGFVSIFVLRGPMEEQHCWFVALVPANYVLILVSLGAIPMVLIFVLYSIILRNALESMSRINCTTLKNLETHARDLSVFRGREEITSYSENDAMPSYRARSFGLLCCRSNTFAIRPTFGENKWKAVKVVVLNTGAFFVSWFPSFVTLIFYVNCDFENNSQYCKHLEYILSNPLTILILTNSLLNPLIYAWWHQGFRESVKKMNSKLRGKIFKIPLKMPSSKPTFRQTFYLKEIGPENIENELETYK